MNGRSAAQFKGVAPAALTPCAHKLTLANLCIATLSASVVAAENESRSSGVSVEMNSKQRVSSSLADQFSDHTSMVCRQFHSAFASCLPAIFLTEFIQFFCAPCARIRDRALD